MKISQEILGRHLKNIFKFKENKALSSELILERPMFYENIYSYNENKVYIGYGSNFSPCDNVKSNSLILSIGDIKEKSLLSFYTVFEFHELTSPFDLFNKVQGIFDIYDNWENNLQQILNKGTSLKDMLDCSFEIFNNPITIFSSDFTLISYSSIIDTQQNLKHLADNDLVYKDSSILKLDPDFNYHRDTTGVFTYPGYDTGLDVLCINIFDHSRYIYRIIICENIHKFYPSDSNLLEFLSTYVDLMIKKIYTIDSNMGYTLDNILYKILTGEIVNSTFIKQMLNEFYWFSDHSYFCINIKIGSLDIQNLTVNSICKQIESLVLNSCAIFYNNDIAVFINLTKFNGTVQDAMNKLAILLRDNYLKAGVSNTFIGFSEIKYNYLQACIALDTGRRYRPYQWIYTFDDIAPFYLIESCTKELPSNLVCSKKILSLINYDKKHETDYYNTLRVYLLNNLNAVKSSNDLFIHRSTFLYRIQKIKDLINIDFDDKQSIFYFIMSFNILEMSKLDFFNYE